MLGQGWVPGDTTVQKFGAPGTRFVSSDWNATYLPSASSDTDGGIMRMPLPCTPLPALILVRTPVLLSRTNTSSRPLVSPGIRLDAVDTKPVYLPFPLSAVP